MAGYLGWPFSSRDVASATKALAVASRSWLVPAPRIWMKPSKPPVVDMPLMGGGVKPMVTASGCIMVTPSTLVLMAEALLSGVVRSLQGLSTAKKVP